MTAIRSLAAVSVLLCGFLSPAPQASAQPRRGTGSPDVDIVLPNVWAGGPILGTHVLPLQLGGYSFQLAGHWGREVFTVQKQGEPVRILQGNLISTKLTGLIGVGAGFEVGLGYDFLCYQTGMRVDRDQPFVDQYGSGNLTGMARWLGRSEPSSSGWRVVGGLEAHGGGYPGDSHTDYFGTDWSAGGRGMIAAHGGLLAISLSSGLDYRNPEHFMDRRHAITWDTQLLAFVHSRWPVQPEVALVLRAHEPFRPGDRFWSATASGGLQVPLGRLVHLGMVGGAALGEAAGAPDVFGLFTVQVEDRCELRGPEACLGAGVTCGDVPDGCGGTIRCGDCLEGSCCVEGTCRERATCGGAGRACGSLPDGCGDLLDCGECGAGSCCTEGGDCLPIGAPCADARLECGVVKDSCGNEITCGPCPAGTECLPEGRCVGTCAAAGYECGTMNDGRGNLLHCGTCPGKAECVDHRCGGGLGAFIPEKLPETCRFVERTETYEVLLCDNAIWFDLGQYCPAEAHSELGSAKDFVEQLKSALRTTQTHLEWDLTVVGWSDEVDFQTGNEYAPGACGGGLLFGEDGYRYLENVVWSTMPDRHVLFGGLRAMALLTLIGSETIDTLRSSDYWGEQMKGRGRRQRSVSLRLIAAKKGHVPDRDQGEFRFGD